MFDFSKIINPSADIAKGTFLEAYSNGIKVQGNVSSTPGDESYDNGWYRPGDNSVNSYCRVSVEAGTDIYISADVTLLNQYSNNSNIMRMYLYGTSNITTTSSYSLTLNQKRRISQKLTVNTTGTYYPVFTLCSNTVLIENIMISTSEDTTYEPYTGGIPSPSPTYPQQIKNIGGNEFDINTMGTRLYRYLQLSEGQYLYSPASDSFSVAIPCKPNRTYKVKHSYTGATIFRTGYIKEAEIEASGNYTVYECFLGTTETEHTITTGEGATYIIFQANAIYMPDIIKTLQVTEIYIKIKKCNKNFCKLGQPYMLMGNNGIIGTSDYPTTIINTKNINSLYISGDFSLVGDNVRLGGCNEYPVLGGTGTRLENVRTNQAVDVTNYNYILITWVVSGGLSQDKIQAIENSFQVEEGTTGSNWVAHAEKTYNFPLSEGQKLMQGGTIENKVINPRKQVIYDGSEDEDWTLRGSNSVRSIYSISPSDINAYTDGNQIPNILSDRFIPVAYNDTWKPGMISRWVDYKRVVLIVSPDLDLTAFKTWLSNNPVTVEYELATPDETAFTSDQQSVIDEIISDGTYKEVTHYTAEASINPDMTIGYYKDLEIWVNNLINS